MKCENVTPLLLAGLATLLLGVIHFATELVRERGDIRCLKATAEGCLIEAFGVSGFRVLVFAAVMMTNPIEAISLSYIWLGSAIIFSFCISGRALGGRQLIGGLAFAAGVVLTLYDGLEAGHLMALCAGLVCR